MTGPNISLLEQTMTYINDHPEQHNQDSWIATWDEEEAPAGAECGSTYACFAGWTMILSGEWKPMFDENGQPWFENVETGLPLASEHAGGPGAMGTARDLLGLTDREASTLFLSAQNRDDVEIVVKAIKNGDDPSEALFLESMSDDLGF